MAQQRTSIRLVSTRPRGRTTGWLLFPAFLIAGALGGFALAAWPDISPVSSATRPDMAVASPIVFPICAGGTRVTCVVDGDTFWLDGSKIRIADIDTPEVGSPGCASEAALGRQATLRMRELLSAGSFDLVTVDRDEDVYGRKLRVVERDGRSLGAMLVAEGLASTWEGRQHEWC